MTQVLRSCVKSFKAAILPSVQSTRLCAYLNFSKCILLLLILIHFIQCWHLPVKFRSSLVFRRLESWVVWYLLCFICLRIWRSLIIQSIINNLLCILTLVCKAELSDLNFLRLHLASRIDATTQSAIIRTRLRIRIWKTNFEKCLIHRSIATLQTRIKNFYSSSINGFKNCF